MTLFPPFARVLLLFLPCLACAQPVSLPAKENFHLFLLIGQSNMAGRGTVAAEDKVPHPRVLMLSKDEAWVPAVDPMHFDKPIAGVGLGRTFGLVIAEARPGVTVGLIPCAVGGSPIGVWQPGAFYEATRTHPWDDAMRRAERALQDGTLKGILWHQGEADSTEKLAPEYAARLRDLIHRLRLTLRAPEVPVVLGQMGHFPEAPWSEWKVQVDRVQRELPKHMSHVAYVSAEGLMHKGDQLHFDAASYRLFGRRYAEAYLGIAGKK